MSFDTIEENRAFAERFEFPFDLLSDPDRAMGLDYFACTLPEEGYAKRISYLIDSEGYIAKAYGHVKPAEHADEVLKDLADL